MPVRSTASGAPTSELLVLLPHQRVRQRRVQDVGVLAQGHHEHHVTLHPDGQRGYVALVVLLRVDVVLRPRYARHRAGVRRRVPAGGGVDVVVEEGLRVVEVVELVQPDVHDAAVGADPALPGAVREPVLGQHLAPLVGVGAQLRRVVQGQRAVRTVAGPVARTARRGDQVPGQVAGVQGTGRRGGRGAGRAALAAAGRGGHAGRAGLGLAAEQDDRGHPAADEDQRQDHDQDDHDRLAAATGGGLLVGRVSGRPVRGLGRRLVVRLLLLRLLVPLVAVARGRVRLLRPRVTGHRVEVADRVVVRRVRRRARIRRLVVVGLLRGVWIYRSPQRRVRLLRRHPVWVVVWGLRHAGNSHPGTPGRQPTNG